MRTFPRVCIFAYIGFSLLCLPFTKCIAQKESNVWVLAGGSKLDFNFSPVRYTWHSNDSDTDFFGGGWKTTSYSDPSTGKLLLCAGAGWLMDSTQHLVDTTGMFPYSLFSGWSGLGYIDQQKEIVGLPGSDSDFYVFGAARTDDWPHGLRYTTLHGLQQACRVTRPQVDVMPYCMPALCIIRHANGRDYWVITANGMLPVFDSFGTVYHTYLLTSSGVNPAPVLSHCGPIPIFIHDKMPTLAQNAWLCASPDGSTVAASDGFYAGVQILHFDRLTGKLTPEYRFTNWFDLAYPYPWVAENDLAFSSNGRFLYRTHAYPGPIPNTWDADLIQYDLSLGNEDSIASKAVALVHRENHGYLGEIARGPDGKIYLLGSNDGYFIRSISVIEDPDSLGAACSYRDSVYDFYPGGYSTLQNICETEHTSPHLHWNDVQSRTLSSCGSHTIALDALGDTTAVSCTWSLPGTENQSATGAHLMVNYDSAGIYPVMLISDFGDEKDTIIQNVMVGQQADLVELPPPVEKKAKVGDTVALPLVVKLSDAVGRSDIPFVRLRCELEMDTASFAIPADIDKAFTAPAGYHVFSADLHGSMCTLTLYGPPLQQVPDTLYFGTAHLVVKPTASPLASIYLSSCAMLTGDSEYDVCVGESNTIGAVRVSALSVSPAVQPVAESVAVYPNPANGSFNLTNPFAGKGGCVARLYDALGRLVESRELSMQEEQVTWDVSKLENGAYLVVLRSGSESSRSKITIAR